MDFINVLQEQTEKCSRFEILTALTMKTYIFRNVAPCRIRCLHLQVRRRYHESEGSILL
jgi:hypothetical protein